MRRIVLTYLFLSIIGILGAVAQTSFNRMDPTTGRDQFGDQVDPNTLPDNLEDSTNTEIQSLPPRLRIWRLSETPGERAIIPADIASLNLQNANLVGGMYGHYNYLGNLDSPHMSRIFLERKDAEPTIFMQPFSSFFARPNEVKLINSNIPFTNLTYYKVGNKVDGEERFKSYFSANTSKRLAFGFNMDYLYGRGYYQNQSTSHLNAGAFASYIGDKYQMQTMYNNFATEIDENGGIQDDRYIIHPEGISEGKKEYGSTTTPVKLEQTANRNKDFYVCATRRYRLDFTRETTTIEGAHSSGMAAANDSVPLPKDTIMTEEFVPVTSFIHTIRVERACHQFAPAQEKEEQYPNACFNEVASRDSATALSIKNVFGIASFEDFSKYAKAGLTAYISHKLSRYELMDTLSRARFDKRELFVGGELAKRQDKTLHYNINDEIGIMDKALGQFRVNADLDLSSRLWEDTVNFYARGYISNTLPSFYIHHYHSNHYCWNNNSMGKEFHTHVGDELDIQRWKTNLRAGMENIRNYAYFNQNAMPVQESGNIQVLSATLKQDFRLDILRLDNKVTWQKSSNETVSPSPQLSLYHNLYLLAKMAKKVLTVQIGANVRYFAKYSAPAYIPAIQQFRLRAADDQVEIGGYPIVDIYTNLHLKQTRIFAMIYHINAGMRQSNYFLVPHHPINPRLFKIGISWNFYD